MNGLLEQIAERQERIETKLDQLLAREPAQPAADDLLTREEAAVQVMKCSVRTLYNQPWRLPPPEPGMTRGRCIRRAAAEEWKRLPEPEQKRRWIAAKNKRTA